MHLPSPSSVCLVAAAGLLTALVPATAASADAAFHSSRYELTAVGGAPLAHGFVVDIHANGPQVYAQERYHLLGALPTTAYDVTLMAYTDTACTTLRAALPETTLITDSHGNAHGSVTFTPEAVEPFRDPPGKTYGLQWVISVKGAPAYATGCEAVTLD